MILLFKKRLNRLAEKVCHLFFLSLICANNIKTKLINGTQDQPSPLHVLFLLS